MLEDCISEGERALVVLSPADHPRRGGPIKRLISGGTGPSVSLSALVVPLIPCTVERRTTTNENELKALSIRRTVHEEIPRNSARLKEGACVEWRAHELRFDGFYRPLTGSSKNKFTLFEIPAPAGGPTPHV